MKPSKLYEAPVIVSANVASHIWGACGWANHRSSRKRGRSRLPIFLDVAALCKLIRSNLRGLPRKCQSRPDRVGAANSFPPPGKAFLFLG